MPAAEPASRPTRRGGAARPSIGARGAVRVGADFTSEFPAADPTSTEGYASLVRAGEAVLSLLDATIQEALHVKHPVFTALAVLDGSPEPLTPSEIADRVLVASATMTATLDQLERRGWARRLPNSADRRSVLVEITPEGRAVTDRMLPVIRSVEKTTMAVLTERERRQLVAMLDKVLRRAGELAAGHPIDPAGPRVRPSRSR
jgi:DNA-binding MarR family transcriptional regulator